jgi:SAM-dependent methyltransferase
MRVKIVIKRILVNFIIELIIKNKEAKIKIVHDFFCNYNGFRSLTDCAKYTGLNIWLCAAIKEYLYEKRMLGLYYFEGNAPPQKYMREYILKKFPQINTNSYILEVGPGENPLFPIAQYKNWYAVDKYFEDGAIKFKGLNWAKNKYPTERIFLGTFEDLNEIFEPKGLSGKFDLVVASHSYEHVFRPIESLKQANKLLKARGGICLFVPDAFTDDPSTKDPTHTLYLVPEMIEEFFHYAGGYKEIIIEPFRPNADLVITAIKE